MEATNDHKRPSGRWSGVKSTSGSSGSSRTNFEEHGKDHWKNKYQHLFYFLGYCVNMKNMATIVMEDDIIDPKPEPVIWQIILMLIVVGGPMVFLQQIIGQFTQRGCISIGAMLPAMYGFGFCMFFVGILRSVLNLHICSGSITYVITTLVNYRFPVWMYCSPKMLSYFPNCFSRADLDLCEDCITSNKSCFELGEKILSARIFRMLCLFDQDPNVTDPYTTLRPQWRQILPLFITILTVYALASRSLKTLDWSLRLSLIFCILGSCVTLVIVFSHHGALRGFSNNFQIDPNAFITPKAWYAAFRRVIEVLELGSGGQVLLGSYMSMDTPSHFRVFYLMTYYVGIVFFYHVSFNLINGLLSCKLNMVYYGLKSAHDIIFILHPTENGLSAAPHLWNLLHFVICWLLSVVNMVLQIVMIEETLAFEFKTQGYQMYTKCLLCIIIFTLCLPFTTPGGLLFVRMLEHALKTMNVVIVGSIFIIISMYNLQRFKDDIHFVLHVAPIWYVQACWIVVPIFSVLILSNGPSENPEPLYFVISEMILFGICLLPLIFGFIYQLIVYTKKNKVHRMTHNPRLEVRYARRIEYCYHRCLIQSRAPIVAMEKELILLDQISYDLKHNEQFKKEYSKIVQELQDHRISLQMRYDYVLDQVKMSHNRQALIADFQKS